MPQRVAVPAFADPSNTADSVAQSVSRSINWYLQTGAPGTTRAPVYPMRTPGVQPWVTWPQGPIRGMLNINNTVYVVGGSTFGSLDWTGTITVLGTVANDSEPVSLCSSGTASYQVMVVSGNLGYVYNFNTHSFGQITSANFPNPCRWGEFFGGYFLALHGQGSRSFQWSALEDATTWNALDVAERSYASDNISALIRSHAGIWLLGFHTSEIWVINQGTGNNVFVPQTGVIVEHGCLGAFTPQRIDNTILWLGQNDDGKCMVWRADGYTPRRVSTHAVETWLSTATGQNGPTDAVGFVMQMDGHIWYHLLVPRDLRTTWVYDVTTDRWHEWAIWDPKGCRYYPHVANSHVFAWNQHLLGSRLDGTIYQCDPSFTTDVITGTLV